MKGEREVKVEVKKANLPVLTEKRFKFVCPHCGETFKESACKDELGWYTVCTECGGSFDIDYDEEKGEAVYEKSYN